MMLLFLSLLYVACLTEARPPSVQESSGLYPHTITLPSADPFYFAPANLSHYAPGAIIRSRPPPNPLAFYNFPTNLASAWQLLYRTTGVNGESLATVTTVLVPHNADFDKLLSYQVEIDSPYDACFPSITLQQPGANLGTLSAQYGELWFISALARGWVVATPDHEATIGAFTSGVIAGHATLDGLRAVLQSKGITGVHKDAKTVIWGYSGGSQATEFALELQEQYAPELEITAAALGGLPANLTNAVGKINKGIGAGLIPSALLGLARVYPLLKTLIDEKVYPSKKSQLLQAELQCAVTNVVDYAFQDIFTYFDGGASLLDEPAAAHAFQDIVMGTRGIPKVPTYIYHGTHDEILPFEDVQALFDKYCAAGANIQLTKEGLSEHVVVALTGAAGALEYLIDRMEGRALEPGCSTRTVLSSALDPASIPILGEFVYSDVLAILGAPVGPIAWLENDRGT